MNVDDVRRKQAAFANQVDPDKVNGCVVAAPEALDDESRAMIAKYDELEAVWNKARDQFASLRFPSAAWVKCDGFDLGWDRYAGKWRIMVDDGKGDPRPISDARMVLRVDAAAYLGELKQALFTKRRELAPKVLDAIRTIQEVLR